mmetsp:Transcript_48024/g.88421  ORF Transcript_48024/g.88421 Transcript_48024/m.88421 type:complete len:895 (+) Transcript_48024:134-2818(+)
MAATESLVSPPTGLPPVSGRGRIPTPPPEPAGGYPRGKPQYVRHPLLEKCSFEQLHRNDVIESKPHTLHFAGFQINKEHSQVLKIVNISPKTLRLAIIPPTTPWFKTNIDKKGLVAPGMSEEIIVTFTPDEWRYYHDALKIFCGNISENLVVPIHAYPSAMGIDLPKMVDFGCVPLGTTRTKSIPLTCKIPIQFEFEVSIIEDHPDFEITPLQGVVPANGTTNLALTFLPTKHRTCRAELQVSVSQFDFEPVNIVVVGNAVPELTKETILQSKQSELEAQEAKKKHDATVAKVMELKEKRTRPKLESKPPLFAVEASHKTIDGVKVPLRMDQAATNFVLNQAPGKLPLKELASFIREQRAAAETRKLKATMGSDLDEEDDDVHAQEMRFEMQFREVAKSDKDKALKSGVARGEAPMSEEAQEKEKERRRARHAVILERRVAEDRTRVASVLTQESVTIPAGYRPHVAPAWDENANDSFSIRLQVRDRLMRAGAKVMARVRADIRKTLLRAALRQNNVTDRAKCKAWVESDNKAAAAGIHLNSTQRGGLSHSETSALSDLERTTLSIGEVLADATSTGPKAQTQQDLTPGIFTIPLDFVLPTQLPISRPSMTSDTRSPVEIEPLDNFETFRPVELKKRLDYKVLQYEPFAVPPPAAYMKLHEGREKLQAALEEDSVRGPCGDIYDGAEVPMAMPDSCLLPPQHDALSLLVPSPDCRTFIRPPDFVECDFEYQLAQCPRAVQPSTTEELIPKYLQTLEEPFLSHWRRQRRIHDPFDVFDPVPICLLEGGGKMGPRVGADAGGERLSFLPVGGFARDIPSDTDSDQREDFEVPALPEAKFEEAMEQMGKPVASELWQKTAAAEERLQKQARENSVVVREKLAELNKDLDYRHKLFLG